MPIEIPDTLPEYADNPFIAGLPAPQSRVQMVSRLKSIPTFKDEERSLPPHLRKHCILRLMQYFEPLDRHVMFCEKFDMLLRQGYLTRNPNTHNYIQRLQTSHDRRKQRNDGNVPLQVFESYASTFALIGASGVGKSKTLSRVLSHYPQIIDHAKPFSLSQIVWIRLDCPSQGSQMQLCRDFFTAVDLLLGTNYRTKHAGQKRHLDDMLQAMGHIANLHAIGALVIDEIQFLRNIRKGSDGLLRFFVTLVNTIGIPVVLVGTNSALPILQDNFKEARRANGLGSTMWDPFPNNANWRHLVNELWKYQWLSTFTPMTDEISNVLYDESQGIVDILIKLFMLVQMRIISICEARRQDEVITTKLIRKVAQEDFRMVRPMLDALRNGDMRALQQYDDLLPFQAHFENLLHSTAASTLVTTHIPSRIESSISKPDDIVVNLRETLLKAGFASDIAEVTIQDALIKHPSGDFMLLMSEIINVVKHGNSAKVSPKRVRTSLEALPTNDLRSLVANTAGISVYEKLLKSDVIKSPEEDFIV